ncbi:hypothetical protein BXU06_05600 [Aquaspirillum sp. LM1]|nr:hypothetical protein BXU06_05600 [Aquaspirillum sp. LM1]
MIATLGRYFFDAFLPKICAKWPVSTIFIPSAEALGFRPFLGGGIMQQGKFTLTPGGFGQG